MSDDPTHEQSETWFGTGLRAHLGIRPQEPAADPQEVVAHEEPARAEHDDAAPTAHDERERELARREQRLAAEAEQLARERAALEARAAELEAAEPGVPVRNVLRDRVEREADRLWRTIDAALEATLEDGRPDFHARLAAIKLLLGEAYGDKPAVETLPARADEQPEDELAQRRAERYQL